MSKQSAKVDLSPKNNFIFKKIFTSPGSESILIDFLSAVLKEDIIEAKLIESESENLGNYITSKAFRFDIKVTLSDGRIIDVEMQKENNLPIEKRLAGYAGRIVSEQLKTGDDYTKIQPAIVICILDYNFIDLPEYHTETITVAKQHREYELSNYIKYHFIELPKFRKCKPDLNNKLDQWLLFLDNLNEELIKMATDINETIKKAEEIHKILKADSQLRYFLDAIELNELDRKSEISYLKEKAEKAEKKASEDGFNNGMKRGIEAGIEKGMKQGIEQGIEKGIEQGIEKGISQNKLETAKKLLNIKMDINQISQICDLPLEKIKELMK